jgi:hypothetical protein
LPQASISRSAVSREQRRVPAAAACQHWQRLQRRARSAEMIDQRAKGARADILTADQAEPIEPLLIRQTYWFSALAHPNPEHPLAVLLPRWNRTHMLQNTA